MPRRVGRCRYGVLAAMSWMAWTAPSATFFVAVLLALATLTVAEVLRPGQVRRGLLGLVTTRGDRFFISLLSGAALHVMWLAATDLPVWWASIAWLVLLVVLMRWG